MYFKKFTVNLLFCSFILCTHSFGQVTSKTLDQIQILLQEKNSRTPAQRKIDSRLLQAVRENRGQQMAAGVTLAPANVDADISGVLKVDISANITDAFLAKITALGARIIYASPKYHTVRATINLKDVEKISTYSEVKFIQPAVKAMLVDVGPNQSSINLNNTIKFKKIRDQLTAYFKKMHPLIGSVTSEGDKTHRAADVRTTYGYLGQGIKIGVLSDSYNAKGGAASDVSKGDLPGNGNPDGYTTPVTVVQDFSGGEDEGRAMLQVIHDLAPAAQLYFATADISEASFASNILTLQSTYGCNIIIDDVAYFDEPAFQDGITAQAVNTVTAAGALYFSSAGNSGSLAKKTSGVYEGDFNDAGSSTFSGSSKAGTIHNFGTVGSPVNGDIIKSTGFLYNLNWSDAWGSSGNDYDLFLVSSSGLVKGSSTNIQNGSQNPYEAVSVRTLINGDRLVVFKTTAAAVRAFHLNTNRGTLTIGTNGQTTGHGCAANAFCMAATPASTAFESGYPSGPYPNPFNSSNQVEPFSSDGPRRIFYNADGSAITAGNFLFGTNGGVVRAKPDLTAADGVKTTFGSTTGLNPFFGTSCAAPHAGAIAALLWSANSSLTTTQIRNILTSTALDVENSGYDNISGYGIIQAFQAAGVVAGGSCSVPSGLSSKNITATAATISWSPVNGSSSYDADYKLHSSSTWTNAATGTTSTSINLSGLSASTLYDWRVRTNCTSGSSDYDTAQFTTHAPTCLSVYDTSVHNTFATAVTIPAKTVINGTLNAAHDSDIYKFKITTAGKLTILLSNLPANYDLYIYNSSQVLVGSSTNSGTAADSVKKSFGTGKFYIKVVNKNGAFDGGKCYSLKIKPITAVVQNSEAKVIADNSFYVFPNPVSSVLNVVGANIKPDATIRVMDVYGKTTLIKKANAYSSQINVSTLATGTYMLVIINKDGSVAYTSRFVKQ